jgi:hypothetical protein
MTGQSQYRPLSVLNKSVVDELADEYLYFDCIRVIHSVSLLRVINKIVS